jgi:thioesterase domain-containing protein
MRKVQPKGPHLIAGYCAGGVIAFEVSRQLVKAGEQVAPLAMLESYAPKTTILAQLRRGVDGASGP